MCCKAKCNVHSRGKTCPAARCASQVDVNGNSSPQRVRFAPTTGIARLPLTIAYGAEHRLAPCTLHGTSLGVEPLQRLTVWPEFIALAIQPAAQMTVVIVSNVFPHGSSLRSSVVMAYRYCSLLKALRASTRSSSQPRICHQWCNTCIKLTEHGGVGTDARKQSNCSTAATEQCWTHVQLRN